MFWLVFVNKMERPFLHMGKYIAILSRNSYDYDTAYTVGVWLDL